MMWLALAAPQGQALLWAQQSGAQESSQETILLLRNGEVLRGKVRMEDGCYEVDVMIGRSRIHKQDVLLCARDMDEIYRFKRALIRDTSAQEHLDLARWCLRCGLTDQAVGELERATKLQPEHPMIAVIERQIKVAKSEAEKEQVAGKAPPQGPSTFDLDRMVRGMPPHTVEMFTQVIQPMLMNNCTAAGCHGQGGEQGFRLIRVPTGAQPSRRLTQRNLYAALQLIDYNKPEASLLLTVPLKPHGTVKAPLFTDHQIAQYQQLVQWCYRVTQTAEPTVMQASFNDFDSAAGSVPAFRPTRPAKLTPRTNRVERDPDDPAPLGASSGAKAGGIPGLFEAAPAGGGGLLPPGVIPGMPQGNAPSQATKRAGTINKFVPSDDQDPAIFNRQFAPPPPQKKSAVKPQPAAPGKVEPVVGFEAVDDQPNTTRPQPAPRRPLLMPVPSQP